MDNPQSKLADDIAAFFLTDAWRVVKYRLLVEYTENLQFSVNMDVKQGNLNSASSNYGKIEGVKEAMDITERIPSEINNGQLAVDVALRVIENKQRKEGKRWLKDRHQKK